MSPVATETPTPGWGLGPTPAYTVIYTGKLHHDRGRYLMRARDENAFPVRFFWECTPPATPARGGDELRDAASHALMYLQTGFMECPQCGHEITTADLDATYALADVVEPAPSGIASTDMAGAGERSSRKLNDWISAALDAPPVEGLTSGEGWQLVPVELTDAMRLAGNRELGFRYEPQAIRAVWSKMLAASPKATATASVREDRPDDEALDPHLPESIRAEKRCGIQRSDWMTAWFVPWSPRNDNQNAEGPWSHWVALANAILAADAKAIATLTDSGTAATIGGERA